MADPKDSKEERKPERPVFSHTEMIGLEKRYNYFSEVKLKRLVTEGIITIGKREIRLKPRFW